jgi:hypothetical protein
VGVSNGDGAWRGLVTIVESIDPRPYIFQPAVYGRLIYTVFYTSDRLLTQENPYPHLNPPPDLRRQLQQLAVYQGGGCGEGIQVHWYTISKQSGLTRAACATAMSDGTGWITFGTLVHYEQTVRPLGYTGTL